MSRWHGTLRYPLFSTAIPAGSASLSTEVNPAYGGSTPTVSTQRERDRYMYATIQRTIDLADEGYARVINTEARLMQYARRTETLGEGSIDRSTGEVRTAPNPAYGESIHVYDVIADDSLVSKSVTV